MILIISTCKDRLSELEFVSPIAKIVKDSGYECITAHYTEAGDHAAYEKIIICGTALMDNAYLEHIDMFSWLKETSVPVLGICSGMQIIALVHGSKITSCGEIGMINVRTIKVNQLLHDEFTAYALHGNGLDLSETKCEALAASEACVQSIIAGKCFGIMFHPEVRNSKIISDFLRSYPGS